MPGSVVPPGRFCVSELRRIASGQDGQFAVFDGRQRVVGGEANAFACQLCKIGRSVCRIRMLQVRVVRQDKAFRDRHGDLTKLVIRFRIIQTDSIINAAVIARQIDTALLESSIDGNKAVLVLAGCNDHVLAVTTMVSPTASCEMSTIS